jgi:hypothetical protein
LRHDSLLPQSTGAANRTENTSEHRLGTERAGARGESYDPFSNY